MSLCLPNVQMMLMLDKTRFEKTKTAVSIIHDYLLPSTIQFNSIDEITFAWVGNSQNYYKMLYI